MSSEQEDDMDDQPRYLIRCRHYRSHPEFYVHEDLTDFANNHDLSIEAVEQLVSILNQLTDDGDYDHVIL